MHYFYPTCTTTGTISDGPPPTLRRRHNNKRARPGGSRFLTTATAALALWTATTTAFQPSAVVVVARSTTTTSSSQLLASTVFPPDQQQQRHHHQSSLLSSSQLQHLDPQQQRNAFHWPWDPHPEAELQHALQQRQQRRKNKNRTAQLVRSPKDVWIQKYCTVEGLRESFGRNQNVLWGDLDASNTRRLYKTLLPVALMDLYQQAPTIAAQDLALLAYKARVAAKLYARERCRVPARIAANLFDGYRQWRKYGSFDCTGMSYQQVWEKYANLIQQETASSSSADTTDTTSTTSSSSTAVSPDKVTEQICLKILEKSCQSNAMIDELVLSSKTKKHNSKHHHHFASAANPKELAHLKAVQEQLERDVRLLLLSDGNNNTETSDDADYANYYPLSHDNIRHWSAAQIQKFRALRAFAKFKRRFAALQHQHQNHSTHQDKS